MPKASGYPLASNYREALFDTKLCFKDPALVGGEVALDALGMPRPISGGSASVFTVRNSGGRRWAVKCFTRYIDHHAARYQRISDTLQTIRKPWRVEFEYLDEGILCEGRWYPALKMEWIEATELIPFIEKHLWEPKLLAGLAERFARMLGDLSARGIAHGDLQHGNLLVTPSGELKLIDYDGMFVPSLAQMGACETGHRHYQSPARTMSTWGPYLDNFSAWIIYSSLIALTIDPTLWSLLHDQGDDALLFHQADYINARDSRALLALTRTSKPELQALGRLMSGLWTPNVPTIPPLNPDDLPKPNEQPLLSTLTPQFTDGTTDATATGSIPDWVTQAQPASQAAASSVRDGASWVAGHLPPLPPVAFSPSRRAIRLLVSLDLTAIAAVNLIAVLGQLSEVAAGVVSWFAVVVFFVVTTVLFRRTPEWRAKHAKLVVLKERRSGASKATREVANLEAARRGLDGREQKSVEKIAKRTDQTRSSEQEGACRRK